MNVVVTPPTSIAPRRLPSGLLAAAFLLLSGMLAAAETGLNWSPVAPEPALVGVPPAASSPQDDLVARATLLERQQRWADVVSICESAARKGTLAPELLQRYDLAKIHCDVARRHTENAFRAQLAKLTEADARRVYAEVLARIASHHVETPQFARLVARGCLAMDVALDDPTFARLVALGKAMDDYDRDHRGGGGGDDGVAGGGNDDDGGGKMDSDERANKSLRGLLPHRRHRPLPSPTAAVVAPPLYH